MTLRRARRQDERLVLEYVDDVDAAVGGEVEAVIVGRIAVAGKAGEDEELEFEHAGDGAAVLGDLRCGEGGAGP